jgi:hypothetical protein
MCDTTELRCQCLAPQCGVDAFHETDIGADTTAERFSNISLFDCRFCGSRWLYCSVAEDVFSRPNRWYRGPISVTQSRSVIPEDAAEILAGLSWYFYGGIDFDTNGREGSGPVSFDHVIDETEVAR